jgi:hypothetical protein
VPGLLRGVRIAAPSEGGHGLSKRRIDPMATRPSVNGAPARRRSGRCMSCGDRIVEDSLEEI